MRDDSTGLAGFGVLIGAAFSIVALVMVSRADLGPAKPATVHYPDLPELSANATTELPKKVVF